MTTRAAPTVVARQPAARTRVFNIEEVDLCFDNGARSVAVLLLLQRRFGR